MPSFCPNGFTSSPIQVTSSSEISSNRDLLKFFPYGIGCQSCSSGQVLLRKPQKSMFCMPSYFAQWNQYPSHSLLISNCKQYKYSNTGTLSADYVPYQSSVKCEKCLNGYLETVDGSSCVAVTSALAQCLLVDSSNGNCTLCSDHYLVQSGVCVPNQIEFCKIAEFSSVNNAIVCASCDDGYFFDFSSNSTGCLPGHLPYCQVYNDNDSLDCLTCQDGYFAVPVDGVKKQCLKLEGTHCKSILTTSTQLGSNQFECTECDNGYFLSKIYISLISHFFTISNFINHFVSSQF